MSNAWREINKVGQWNDKKIQQKHKTKILQHNKQTKTNKNIHNKNDVNPCDLCLITYWSTWFDFDGVYPSVMLHNFLGRSQLPVQSCHHTYKIPNDRHLLTHSSWPVHIVNDVHVKINDYTTFSHYSWYWYHFWFVLRYHYIINMFLSPNITSYILLSNKLVY